MRAVPRLCEWPVSRSGRFPSGEGTVVLLTIAAKTNSCKQLCWKLDSGWGASR